MKTLIAVIVLLFVTSTAEAQSWVSCDDARLSLRDTQPNPPDQMDYAYIQLVNCSFAPGSSTGFFAVALIEYGGNSYEFYNQFVVPSPTDGLVYVSGAGFDVSHVPWILDLDYVDIKPRITVILVDQYDPSIIVSQTFEMEYVENPLGYDVEYSWE